MVSEIAEQEVGRKEAVSRERKGFSGKGKNVISLRQGKPS